ncbi:MAG: GNAT family N-acetyltransferase [Actinomycetota bacterium]|nr:GNAT family N-acetyltransferase [Actinomycetota bacterium]
MAAGAVQSARFDQLDARTAYLICRLRVDVFVVEQRCPYAELDGRDLEPGTTHLWLGEPATGSWPASVTAYLRLLSEPDGSTRIGRVCVAAAHRGRGQAAALMTEALRLLDGRSCRLDAQTYLTGWYARWGFVADGPEFLEDGIPHVSMCRAKGGQSSPAETR